MQQATVNLFADMGVQPATRQPGLVPATASTDHTAPTSTITAPSAGSSVTSGTIVTITGTAVDSGGGVVGGVEISTDGGTTWHPATGRGNWSYSWQPKIVGSTVIKSRAVDDSGNLESPSAGRGVTVAPCTSCGGFWSNTADPYRGGLGTRQSGGVGNAVPLRCERDHYRRPILQGEHQYGHPRRQPLVKQRNLASDSHVHSGNRFRLAAGGFFDTGIHHGQHGLHGVLPHSQWPLQRRPELLHDDWCADNSPLHIIGGVYAYGTTSTAPTQTSNGTNYWVDVMFTSGAPSSIVVTPATSTISTGTTQSFTATGNYPSGATQNLTSQVAWTSSSTSVATINSTGLATAGNPGSTTISATLGTVTGSTTLTVQATPLTIITTSLPGGSLEYGLHGYAGSQWFIDSLYLVDRQRGICRRAYRSLAAQGSSPEHPRRPARSASPPG